MKLRALPRLFASAVAFLFGEIGAFELLLLAGLALIAYGAWTIFPPAGYLLPGGVMIAFAWRGMSS